MFTLTRISDEGLAGSVNEKFLTITLFWFDIISAKSLTINANRYVDILSVGSNVVTVTGMPSMIAFTTSAHKEERFTLC